MRGIEGSGFYRKAGIIDMGKDGLIYSSFGAEDF